MKSDFLTLGIETSCDETAVSILCGPHDILANEISSQNSVHAHYGGIVPEIAARIHAELINHMLQLALDNVKIDIRDISLVAVTAGPGLAVSLVAGLSCARALKAALGVPVVGTNHLEGHLMSNFLMCPEPKLPAVCLLVSGGHTDLILVRDIGNYEVLGRTRDDAAGEAFDKAARLMELGYPGGPAIQKAAELSSGVAVVLPRPMLHEGNFDFSFSGLKTAVINYVRKQQAAGLPVPNNELAAGFQEAVVDVLVTKTMRAAKKLGIDTVLLCGGVAANRALREKLKEKCDNSGLAFFSPPFAFCTDNAAMVARAGYENHHRKLKNYPLSPQPGLSL